MSSLPPLVSTGVFSVSTSCVIDAPIKDVWSTLIDFPSYNDWNPFVCEPLPSIPHPNLLTTLIHSRSQVVSDASGAPLPEQTLRPGTYLSIRTHIPPSMEKTRFPHSAWCLVTVVDHENYRAAWVYDAMPKWLLNSERWQTLTLVDGKTRYESREVFCGILAYFVMFFFQPKLKLAFDVMAQALKERAEHSQVGTGL